MKKLIIIDEYFVNTVGHYYEYSKSVKEIFEERDIAVAIYANQKVELGIQDELGAIPYFEGLQKNALNKLPLIGQLLNRISFWRKLYKKLRELYRKENDPDTVFFYTTVVWYNVLAVALAASKSNRKSILLYRLSISEHAGLPQSLTKMGNWLYQYTFKRLRLNKNVLFVTDSDVIAAECNEKYHCNMCVLPIPHIKDEGPPAAATPVEQYRLYAPGAIREEKGIEFITRSFEYLNRIKHPLLGKVTLVTQYNDAGSPELNDNIRGRLTQLAMEHVFLGSLSSEAYTQQLNDAHIVLIPYSIDHGYRARTSGIMSETIATCKPFITTQDSWMSIQSTKYQTGISVPYNDMGAFAAALSELIADYPLYRKKAIHAREAWLAYHSKQNFYNLLSGVIQGK